MKRNKHVKKIPVLKKLKNKNAKHKERSKNELDMTYCVDEREALEGYQNRANDTSCVSCSGCSAWKSPYKIEIKHRSIYSHMVMSHIPLMTACLWWVLGANRGSHTSHVVDKFMAIVLTTSVMMSILYHYYYECVLCIIEEQVNTLGALILNVYMYYRGVPIYLILLAGIVGVSVKLSVNYFAMKHGLQRYEKYHPFCHYVAGTYVTICVYLIQTTFT